MADARPRQAGRRRPAGPARAPARADPKGDRIAKLLARAGVASRRDAERMIADGRVALHGAPVSTPATILASLDGVTVDGQPVARPEPARLFRFHKPPGFLTTARDPGGRPTIFNILPPPGNGGPPRLMPVGRLDLNTEGLLLLTNDGALKRYLELPANAVPRTYRVRAQGEVRQSDLEALAEGVILDGVRYGPVEASVDRRASRGAANIWLTMRLTEGKNREVRRLCEAMGLRVSRLIRTAYGPVTLGDLPPRALEEVPGSVLATLRPRERRPAGDRRRPTARER
jgi:23S rRNA pseudouridine2605 synthase